jgi:phosphohistidine swiveling domain-containing protein
LVEVKRKSIAPQVTPSLIVDLADHHLPPTIGNKARQLRDLVEAGFRVPPTLVCTWEAHQAYLDNRVEMITQLTQELDRKINPKKLYAVRSSANLEDNISFSFAGQFNSYLNIRGVDGIITAAWGIWSMTQSTQVQEYLKRHDLISRDLQMAVIIQEMVPPVISGVVFSRNPVTGADEVVAEAVHGPGKNLLEDGKTPARWVQKENRWLVKPMNCSIPQELISQVVQQTRRIAKKFSYPLDLEWVYDGNKLFWVQMRQITALPQNKVYSNQIAKDMLPGLISPLVWSINIPIVNAAWIDLLTEVIGPNDLKPEDLARPFYFRAYFEMGAFQRIFKSLGLPDNMLERMMGIPSSQSTRVSRRPGWKFFLRLPRLMYFLWDKTHSQARLQRELPQLQTEFDQLSHQEIAQLSPEQLQQAIVHLSQLLRRAAYWNILAPMLMSAHAQILRWQLRSSGLDYDQLDVIGEVQTIQELDPGQALRHLSEAYHSLDLCLQEELATQPAQAMNLPDLEGFRFVFQGFLDRFGHLSNSGNDFSSVPWREQPELVLQMVRELQPETSEAGHAKLKFDQLPLPSVKRRLLRPIFNRLQRYWFFREKIGSLYTYGYGLFRPYFRAIAEYLLQRGQFSHWEDIFYLTWDEIQSVLNSNSVTAVYADLVQQRRHEMEDAREVVLPTIIYGEHPTPQNLSINRQLQGIPTSGGTYTGKLVVVNGIQDWQKVTHGCVLVVPYSDVGWTPLFMKAGGIISESGGILSHCSVIAREYGLPAVVAVENATHLLDGQLVTVDGYQGLITLHD